MWNGKKKAPTVSSDDGVTQDIRLVEILNRYGLKGTFNINSGLLGLPGALHRDWGKINHTKIKASEVKELYAGHEVAVHSLTHPTLVGLEEETIIRQVEEDRKALEGLCGYPIVGMAYPNGPFDKRVIKAISENTPIRYSRTTESTHSFEVQKENLLAYNPTVYYREDCLEEMIDKFLESESEEDQLLYIWGHSYELDDKNIAIDWETFDRLCKKLAFRKDIFYGTNKEVLL